MSIRSTYSHRSLSSNTRVNDGHSVDASVIQSNRSWWQILAMTNPIMAGFIMLWEVLTFKRSPMKARKK